MLSYVVGLLEYGQQYYGVYRELQTLETVPQTPSAAPPAGLLRGLQNLHFPSLHMIVAMPLLLYPRLGTLVRRD